MQRVQDAARVSLDGLDPDEAVAHWWGLAMFEQGRGLSWTRWEEFRGFPCAVCVCPGMAMGLSGRGSPERPDGSGLAAAAPGGLRAALRPVPETKNRPPRAGAGDLGAALCGPGAVAGGCPSGDTTAGLGPAVISPVAAGIRGKDMGGGRFRLSSGNGDPSAGPCRLKVNGLRFPVPRKQERGNRGEATTCGGCRSIQ